MRNKISLLKLIITAFVAITALWGNTAMAADNNAIPGIGLPGPISKSGLEVSEVRISYRFDQQNSQGKAQQAVPVQMTFRVHNPGKTETAKIAIPVQAVDGRWAELAAIYINGREIALPRLASATLPDGNNMHAYLFNLNVLNNADAIVDIRVNQPQNKDGYAFRIGTGANWNGNLEGSLEALFPYNAQNWNTALRKINTDEMVPLAYSGKSAIWEFSNLKPAQENDVFWLLADPVSMEYFDRGSLLHTQSQGNSLEAYEMMMNALLDMEPCNGARMPMVPWWTNTYETIATGIVSLQPTESIQLYKAMEIWSSNWTVASGQEKSCIELRQNPERYRSILRKIIAMPADQRSSELNDALEQHFNFLKKLSSVLGDNSLASASSPKDLLTSKFVNSASQKDRAILANWDDRFAQPAATSATSSASSGNFKLSKTWQIIIYSILALLVLIGVALIATRWKGEDERTTYDVQRTTSERDPGLFMATKDEERKDFQNLMKPWESQNTKPVTHNPTDSAPDEKLQDTSYKFREDAKTTEVKQEEHKIEPPKQNSSSQGLIKPQTPEPKKTDEDDFKL